MAIKITSGENKPQKTYNTSQPIPIQKNQMGAHVAMLFHW